jgi:hypothetical protein
MDENERDERDEFRPQGGGLQVKEGHQEVDFSVRMIVVSVVFLVISGIAVMVASVGIMKGLDWWEKKHDAQLTPVQEQLSQERAAPKQPEGVKPPPDWDERAQEESRLQKTFPTPRLQYDDVRDMNQLRANEDDLLTSTGKNPDGSVHIPVARAMELLSKEGLPAVSGPFVPSVPLPVEPVTSSPDAKAKVGTKKAGQ